MKVKLTPGFVLRAPLPTAPKDRELRRMGTALAS
jgi:hypothetical protein